MRDHQRAVTGIADAESAGVDAPGYSRPGNCQGRFSARIWRKALPARRKRSWRRTSGKF